MPEINQNQVCPQGSFPYIIRKGDTFYNIAHFYGTTVEQIMRFNPGANPNNLQIGQQICVPGEFNIYPACPTTNYYVVMQGDTLSSIAEYFGITEQQLLAANHGISPDIYLNQVLCIPASSMNFNIWVNSDLNRLIGVRNGITIFHSSIYKSRPYVNWPSGIYRIINKQFSAGVEFGARWMGLSVPGIGIRAINTPLYLPGLSTPNDIILTNLDMTALFNLTPVGTNVTIC